MVAASYTTDLTTIFADQGTGDWTAVGGGQAGLNQETDYFIQNTSCLSKNAWASDQKGMFYDYVGAGGTAVTLPTDGAVVMWVTHLTPNSLANKSAGGITVGVGNGTAAYYRWNVAGADTETFGGWVFAAVNMTVTQDSTVGSPSGTWDHFGAEANLPTGGPTKGAPFGIDAIREGRMELVITDGDLANGYGTFEEANTTTDSLANRYGHISLRGGSYFISGLFVFGSASTSVDFRDSNKTVFIRDHDRVTANFNTFEVRNSGSNVDIEAVSFTALGTVSPGRWVTTDNATVALTGCTFTDMGAFGFNTNTTASGCVFRRCAAITAVGATLTDSLVTDANVTANNSALIWDTASDPDGELDGMTFEMGTTETHAIEFGTTSPLTMTLRNVSFTNYDTVNNNQNDSTLHFKRTTGTITLNIVGGDTPTYRTDGATVNIVANPVTVQVTVTTTGGTAIENARVIVETADGTGPFPYQDAVTITNSTTTATVTHTGHGLASNDKVVIRGATQTAYNGVFQITVTDANTYTYTMSSDPGGNATGSPVSSFVALAGLTNGSGIISASRVYSSNQPVVGVARKATGSPLYKPAGINGTVLSASGLTASVPLISDD